MVLQNKRAGFSGSDLAHGDGVHRTFSKEISGKKVSDLLFVKLLSDPLMAPFWEDNDMESIGHQQDVMMELAFGAGFQPEDEKYLREVHAEAIKELGINERHYDAFIKHFDATLTELGEILPADKVKEAKVNVRAARVIFAGKKK